MWSYMMIFNQARVRRRAGRRSTYSVQGQAFLENLAVAARGLAEPERRHSGGAVERADEVGEVAESDVVGDVGDRNVVVRQQPRGVTQSRAHKILMRGDAKHA